PGWSSGRVERLNVPASPEYAGPTLPVPPPSTVPWMKMLAPGTGAPSGPSTCPETTTGGAVSPTRKGDPNCPGSETGNAATAPGAPGPGLTWRSAPPSSAPMPNDSWNPPAVSAAMRGDSGRPSVVRSWTVGGTGS